MATGADTFHSKFGDPDPRTPDGLPDNTAEPYWQHWRDTTGSGWFANRFLYLFGPGLERLEACLEAWSFIVPPKHPNRIILGYNAYGAILVLEDSPGTREVRILNPLTVQYWGDSNLTFASLIGGWLPEKRLPRFFDTSVYEAWRKQQIGAYLGEGEILGIGVPLTLEGKMKIDNFARVDIVDYYIKAAPAYAEAFAAMKG